MRAHAAAGGLDDSAIIVNTLRRDRRGRAPGAPGRYARPRRENPDARIIVTGCAAQTEPQGFAALAEVDHVIGNDEKMRPATFAGLAAAGAERVLVNDIMSVRETADIWSPASAAAPAPMCRSRTAATTAAPSASFPTAAGHSRSVPAGEVVAQIRRLVEHGCREVVLTGVDITAYGADLPGELTLGKLVRKILKLVPELPRLRLSSIDTIEADAPLMRALAEEERLMPHLHLSLQAGDDMILKRMKRRHSRADAVAFCAEARRLRPDVVFGADIIAGFPTETDAMFANSLRMVDECGLTFLHVFPFSPRPGTPAARMPQVDRGRRQGARGAAARQGRKRR